jgi:hypothetical protein
MGIKAIETVYKGYRFRSRLEARWAVFFDALGLEWEYEKEGYQLSGTGYLPDFWFPKFNCFAEVKPKVFTIEEYQKCLQLPRPCIMIYVSHQQARSYFVAQASEESCFYSEYEKDGFGRMIFCQSIYKGNIWFLFGESHNDYNCNCIDAEYAAKSARFEYGEQGIGIR